MARRSPARLLAPLALVGFVVALIVVLNSSGSGGGSSSPSGARPAATTTSSTSHKQTTAHKGRRHYTVKPGDTPSGIAEKTGVPLSKIMQLNPNLDEQSLSVGDKIKLR